MKKKNLDLDVIVKTSHQMEESAQDMLNKFSNMWGDVWYFDYPYMSDDEKESYRIERGELTSRLIDLVSIGLRVESLIGKEVI